MNDGSSDGRERPISRLVVGSIVILGLLGIALVMGTGSVVAEDNSDDEPIEITNVSELQAIEDDLSAD